jgi:hypothetical protein
MATALGGAIGGLLATVAMLPVLRGLGGGGPLPAASLLASVAGGPAEDHLVAGTVLHLVYGILAGVGLAVGAPTVGVSMDPLAVGTAVGLAYGLALGGVGALAWRVLADGPAPGRDAAVALLASHGVYGLTLSLALSLLTYT